MSGESKKALAKRTTANKEVEVSITERSDTQLVEEVKAGDTLSFEELIGRYTDKAFSLATRLTRSEQDAEEVLQDVFSTVFRKIDRFEGKSAFSSWLYRITVNASFMRLRRNRFKRFVSLEEINVQTRERWVCSGAERNAADNMTYRSELRVVLEDEVRRLPDEYRPVFVMRDVDGLTNREVSQILQITIPAVKSRLHRARMLLRRKLKGVLDDVSSLGQEERSEGRSSS